jgi:glutamate dehydrogenase (NAD(P)+)
VFTLEAALATRGEVLAGQRVAIQGYGSVGSVIATELAARGAQVVAVSDVTTGVVDPNGLDLTLVSDWIAEHRFLRDFPSGQKVSKTEVLEVPCDILIPAAIECQITEENAPRLDCRLVIEAANGPTTVEGDAILAEREIEVIPDVVANAGGVTVSYYEWVQDQQKYFWDADDVARRLEQQLRGAFELVIAASQRLGVDLRTAAQAVAVERVAEAARLRAIYP